MTESVLLACGACVSLQLLRFPQRTLAHTPTCSTHTPRRQTGERGLVPSSGSGKCPGTFCAHVHSMSSLTVKATT
jgi:hypothetical protein